MENMDFDDLNALEETTETLSNSTIADSTTLPSKGLIYQTNKKVPQFITLKSMTLRNEMQRCAPSQFQYKNTALLIDACRENEGADKLSAYDMAIGDYEFLLHKLRMVTYGPQYKMSIWCQHCGKAVETTADLTDETVIEFDKKTYDEERVLTLPSRGDVVTLRPQTPHLLDAITSRIKELNQKNKDSGLAYDLLVITTYLIEEINGVKVDLAKAQNFVNTLQALDVMMIINAADRMNRLIGINHDLFVVCPECGGEIKTVFRDGPEFFRPTTV